MMKKNWYFLMVFVLLSSLFVSCSDDDDDDNQSQDAYESGVFISHEGVFQTGTGTISFFDRNTLTVESEIFQQVNNRPLGNIVNSVEVFGDNAYLVVNNAQKVEVVSYKDFNSIGVITGLELPRYFLGVDNSKAYISQWGATGMDGSIKVIDLGSLTIDKSIDNIGQGSGVMLLSGSKVYVANSGGYGNDSAIVEINTQMDTVSSRIVVGHNPNSMVVDANGMLWVLCGGKWKSDWSGLEYPGKLVEINPADNSILLELNFTSEYSTPKKLQISKDKNTLFYIYNGGVYAHNINSSALNTSALVARSFYSIEVDPVEGYIYACDPKDYVSNGTVFRYQSDGIMVDSFSVGVIPGDFYFN